MGNHLLLSFVINSCTLSHDGPFLVVDFIAVISTFIISSLLMENPVDGQWKKSLCSQATQSGQGVEQLLSALEHGQMGQEHIFYTLTDSSRKF